MISILNTESEWDQAKSATTPKVIFKKSPICPTSFTAETVFTGWQKTVDGDAGFYSVDVINARPLSNALASDLGVVHQSPQVLVLDAENNLIDHASHYSITADWLSAAFSKASV